MSNVMIDFGALSGEPCKYKTDYRFCPITFKAHMQVVYDERRNPIDFGSQSKRPRHNFTICLFNFIGTNTDYGFGFYPITFSFKCF